MSFESPDEIPQSEQISIQKPISDKYEACWGIAADKFNGNVHAMTHLLYQSLYNPDYFRLHEAEFASGRFPGRSRILTAPGPQLGHPPAEADFTSRLTRVVRREVDYGACVYPGAVEQVRRLTEKGPVVIWTSGDTLGIEDFEGSMVQHSKVLAAGFNTLRTELTAGQGQKRTGILSVMAANNKLAEGALSEMAERSKGRLPIVIEDRLQNLIAVQEKLPDIMPVWVQQDKHGSKVPESLQAKSPAELQHVYNAIESITDLSAKVDVLLAEHTGEAPIFFVDYDGTLSNDTLRMQMQERKVLETLQENNWM